MYGVGTSLFKCKGYSVVTSCGTSNYTHTFKISANIGNTIASFNISIRIYYIPITIIGGQPYNNITFVRISSANRNFDIGSCRAIV